MMEFEAFAVALDRAWRSHDAGLVVLRHHRSTQDVARRLAREYGREGADAPRVDILALEQSAGHGRGDHPWSSPAGLGVYATALRTLPASTPLQMLPHRVAVALCETLGAWVPECRIKWPNDLVVGGRKLGGILVEVSSRGNAVSSILVGFGINHRGPASAFDAPAAISVTEARSAEAESPPTLETLASRTLAAVGS